MRNKGLIVALAALMLNACEGLTGPDRNGEFVLSSQLFGTEDYYLNGWSYEKSEMYRYPFTGDPEPDIINEGFLVIGPSGQSSLPGFNTPGMMNGFALAGEFDSYQEASDFYQAYGEVESGLQFEVVSDTVKLNQVWVQLTADGNYVKLLVKDIQVVKPESGKVYNELSLKYSYQPDGSSSFED